MTLNRLAEIHRVHVRRDVCGDPIIPGKNGHLYVDGGKVYVCFTDDNPLGGRRKTWLTPRHKANAVKKLGDGLIRMQQEGDCEFIAEIDPDWIDVALFRALSVKRRRVLSDAELAARRKGWSRSPLNSRSTTLPKAMK